MAKKSLRESNPWLRDPATCERGMFLSAASSSAVEGIRKPFADKSIMQGRRKSSVSAQSRV